MKPALVSDIACAAIVMVSNITTITAIVQTIFDPEYHLSQNIRISPPPLSVFYSLETDSGPAWRLQNF